MTLKGINCQPGGIKRKGKKAPSLCEKQGSRKKRAHNVKKATIPFPPV